MDERERIYNEVFGNILDNKNEEEVIAPLEALFEYEENEHSYEKRIEEWMNTELDYIPSYLEDSDYIEYIEQEPVAPLSKEKEFSASNLGLQELRKTKKYIKEMHKAISIQLKKIYVTYPLLLEKHYEDSIMKVQEEMSRIIDDMEHFVAGDINKMERIKEDWRLFQEFEKKRLTLLHKISNYYEDRK